MVYTSTARLNYDCQSQRLGISILFKRESLLHSVVGEPKVIGHQVKYRLCFPSSHKHRDHNHSRTHRNRGLCRNAPLRETCIVQAKQKNQATENPHRSEFATLNSEKPPKQCRAAPSGSESGTGRYYKRLL